MVNQERVCQQLNSIYAGNVTEYLSVANQLGPDTPPSPATNCTYPNKLHFNENVLPQTTYSRFEYTCVPGGAHVANNTPVNTAVRTVFIEPIAGTLRHPSICLDGQFDKWLLRKDYIYIDGWAIHNTEWTAGPSGLVEGPIGQRTKRQYYYFDVGASTWTTGAGGASQPWFTSAYAGKCVQFDHIYAWEAQTHLPRHVFRHLPGPLKAKYHWYNIPASVGIGNWDNPLTFIANITSVDDFVVLKLDIDTWAVEEEFVSQILATPSLYSRIDEMFWEHHVPFDPMNRAWGPAVHRGSSMNNSLHMFHQLRIRGVRVHSW
eukprot:CAMPEP_0173392158 /NCGR_PEP_ID=MMETSP1356-20130122/18791_1 /TAXON_ID=77927 ORGANISM="Hemiselmis virescens, Strain PCC157" /NCGR_SAMPLE_ID=MMETSP1356 /ASSEMBLY_ACC=CAM_ASM_000847 /LENGTH=317 /DNA_ID=CAMNT_0014349887 /DNA_START=343 /DNA_END=1293 /DNA_ORIENTATION=+